MNSLFHEISVLIFKLRYFKHKWRATHFMELNSLAPGVFKSGSWIVYTAENQEVVGVAMYLIYIWSRIIKIVNQHFFLWNSD